MPTAHHKEAFLGAPATRPPPRLCPSWTAHLWPLPKRELQGLGDTSSREGRAGAGGQGDAGRKCTASRWSKGLVLGLPLRPSSHPSPAHRAPLLGLRGLFLRSGLPHSAPPFLCRDALAHSRPPENPPRNLETRRKHSPTYKALPGFLSPACPPRRFQGLSSHPRYPREHP